MKKTITFESAALAMVKSTLLEYLEVRAFNSDCIDIRSSIFRKKVRLSLVRSAVSPTKYGTVEPKKREMPTIRGVYVDIPTPGRKNHYKDVSVTVDVAVSAVSEGELTREFHGTNLLYDLDECDCDCYDCMPDTDDGRSVSCECGTDCDCASHNPPGNIEDHVDAAIESVEGSRITAVCRMEIVKFGNVWSPVSVTARIDGEEEWDDFLSGYDTSESSLPRNAKIDEDGPKFAPDFKWFLSL